MPLSKDQENVAAADRAKTFCGLAFLRTDHLNEFIVFPLCNYLKVSTLP